VGEGRGEYNELDIVEGGSELDRMGEHNKLDKVGKLSDLGGVEKLSDFDSVAKSNDFNRGAKPSDINGVWNSRENMGSQDNHRIESTTSSRERERQRGRVRGGDLIHLNNVQVGGGYDSFDLSGSINEEKNKGAHERSVYEGEILDRDELNGSHSLKEAGLVNQTRSAGRSGGTFSMLFGKSGIEEKMFSGEDRIDVYNMEEPRNVEKGKNMEELRNVERGRNMEEPRNVERGRNMEEPRNVETGRNKGSISSSVGGANPNRKDDIIERINIEYRLTVQPIIIDSDQPISIDSDQPISVVSDQPISIESAQLIKESDQEKMDYHWARRHQFHDSQNEEIDSKVTDVKWTSEHLRDIGDDNKADLLILDAVEEEGNIPGIHKRKNYKHKDKFRQKEKIASSFKNNALRNSSDVEENMDKEEGPQTLALIDYLLKSSRNKHETNDVIGEISSHRADTSYRQQRYDAITGGKEYPPRKLDLLEYSAEHARVERNYKIGISDNETRSKHINFEPFDMPHEGMAQKEMSRKHMSHEDMPREEDMSHEHMSHQDMSLEDVPHENMPHEDKPHEDMPHEDMLNNSSLRLGVMQQNKTEKSIVSNDLIFRRNVPPITVSNVGALLSPLESPQYIDAPTLISTTHSSFLPKDTANNNSIDEGLDVRLADTEYALNSAYLDKKQYHTLSDSFGILKSGFISNSAFETADPVSQVEEKNRKHYRSDLSDLNDNVFRVERGKQLNRLNQVERWKQYNRLNQVERGKQLKGQNQVERGKQLNGLNQVERGKQLNELKLLSDDLLPNEIWRNPKQKLQDKQSVLKVNLNDWKNKKIPADDKLDAHKYEYSIDNQHEPARHEQRTKEEPTQNEPTTNNEPGRNKLRTENEPVRNKLRTENERVQLLTVIPKHTNQLTTKSDPADEPNFIDYKSVDVQHVNFNKELERLSLEPKTTKSETVQRNNLTDKSGLGIESSDVDRLVDSTQIKNESKLRLGEEQIIKKELTSISEIDSTDKKKRARSSMVTGHVDQSMKEDQQPMGRVFPRNDVIDNLNRGQFDLRETGLKSGLHSEKTLLHKANDVSLTSDEVSRSVSSRGVNKLEPEQFKTIIRRREDDPIQWLNTFHVTQQLEMGVLRTVDQSSPTKPSISLEYPSKEAAQADYNQGLNPVDREDKDVQNMFTKMDATVEEEEGEGAPELAVLVPARRAQDGSYYFKPAHTFSDRFFSKMKTIQEYSPGGNVQYWRNYNVVGPGSLEEPMSAEAFHSRSPDVGLDILGGRNITWGKTLLNDKY